MSNLDLDLITDLDLHALEEPQIEQLPDGNALGTWGTASTLGTAGCPVSSAGSVSTAGSAGLRTSPAGRPAAGRQLAIGSST